MMANLFERGSTPAILWSLAVLLFWAAVAALRLTLRAMRSLVFLGVGFWLGYAALSARRQREQ
jgi:hypothetical protein